MRGAYVERSHWRAEGMSVMARRQTSALRCSARRHRRLGKGGAQRWARSNPNGRLPVGVWSAPRDGVVLGARCELEKG